MHGKTTESFQPTSSFKQMLKWLCREKKSEGRAKVCKETRKEPIFRYPGKTLSWLG